MGRAPVEIIGEQNGERTDDPVLEREQMGY